MLIVEPYLSTGDITEQFKIRNSNANSLGIEEYWLKVHINEEFTS